QGGVLDFAATKRLFDLPEGVVYLDTTDCDIEAAVAAVLEAVSASAR
ncbi:MAG: hypothetical protein RIR74_1349, partial [Pseudomonadota bacterium]